MQRPAVRTESDLDWWWIFDPRISLRARAALIFGGSAVAFILFFSSLVGKLSQRALERQLGANFETLAFQMSDKLDRVIHQRFHELQLAASLGPFRTGDGSAAERRQMLEALHRDSRDFAWIGFADPAGRVRAATNGFMENTPVDSQPWFRVGRERPYAGPLNEIPALARELTQSADSQTVKFLDLATPVQATNGQFLGVLGAYLQWEWAREVQLSVVPEAARRERIGVTVYNASGDVLLDSGGSGWTQPPELPALSDPRRFRGSLREGTSGGTEYITGFARSRGYREYRGFGWIIVVRQPADLALAPARDLQRVITGWGMVLAVILVLVSWFGAARVVRRLRAVGTAAARIRSGDVLTVMPPQRGESEMAQMCGALGEMVDDFRARQEALTLENQRLSARAPQAESTRR